jgi:hypothetical protein
MPNRLEQLNAICPYYTMFPLAFPLSRLQGARHGEWVLDPFCGRGTTNYAARLLGLPSVGVDSNPVAAAIAEAKLVAPSAAAVVKACERMLRGQRGRVERPQGEFWRLCYGSRTLSQICLLRDTLIEDCKSPARKGLRALLLGCLHGPRTKGRPSYLSNQMPRTYAAKPAYAVGFWKDQQLLPPEVDVLEVVRWRAEHYFGEVPDAAEGKIVCADSRRVDLEALGGSAWWVITSPPYYGMRTYVPDQWLRNWFLGGPSEVDYRAEAQLRHLSPDVFVDELAGVWRNVARASKKGARMVVRFGGISDRQQDPRDLLRRSLRAADCGWKLLTATVAPGPPRARRQANQFQTMLPEPIQEHDYYARYLC